MRETELYPATAAECADFETVAAAEVRRGCRCCDHLGGKVECGNLGCQHCYDCALFDGVLSGCGL